MISDREQSMDDKTLDQRIADMPYPKVTEAQMKDRIEKVTYFVHQPLTVCIIHVNNGFTVTGESACADPRNYDEKIGKELAFKNAFSHLWPLFGFLLAEELFKARNAGIPV